MDLDTIIKGITFVSGGLLAAEVILVPLWNTYKNYDWINRNLSIREKKEGNYAMKHTHSSLYKTYFIINCENILDVYKSMIPEKVKSYFAKKD